MTLFTGASFGGAQANLAVYQALAANSQILSFPADTDIYSEFDLSDSVYGIIEILAPATA